MIIEVSFSELIFLTLDQVLKILKNSHSPLIYLLHYNEDVTSIPHIGKNVKLKRIIHYLRNHW